MPNTRVTQSMLRASLREFCDSVGAPCEHETDGSWRTTSLGAGSFFIDHYAASGGDRVMCLTAGGGEAEVPAFGRQRRPARELHALLRVAINVAAVCEHGERLTPFPHGGANAV